MNIFEKIQSSTIEGIIRTILELTVLVISIIGIFIVFTQRILPIYNHSNSTQETKVESFKTCL